MMQALSGQSAEPTRVANPLQSEFGYKTMHDFNKDMTSKAPPSSVPYPILSAQNFFKPSPLEKLEMIKKKISQDLNRNEEPGEFKRIQGGKAIVSPLKDQPMTVSYTVHKAQQEILGLLKANELEITPPLKDQITRAFETLCDNLKEAAVDFQLSQEGKPRPTNAKEFSKKLQALHEDFNTIQQSLGTNGKLLSVEFDKINMDLGILKNSTKLPGPTPDKSRMESLRSSPGRSRSSNKDDAWGAKIGSIQAQLVKLSGELSQRNDKIAKYEELFAKQDRVVRSLLTSYTQVMYSKERDYEEEQKNVINYEALLKQKDEEIFRLNAAYKMCAQKAAIQSKPKESQPKIERTIERPLDGMLEKLCAGAGNLLSTMDRLKSAVCKSDDKNIEKYKYALDSAKKKLQQLINSAKYRIPLPSEKEDSKSDSELKQIIKEKRALEEKLFSQSQEMQQYENNLLDYIQKVKEQAQELEALKQENSDKKSSPSRINCSPIVSLVQKASRSLESKMKNLKDKCARKTNQIDKVISKIPELRSTINSAAQQLSENYDKIEALATSNEKLKSEQSSTQREIAKLRKMLDEKEKSGNSGIQEKEEQLQEAREMLELAGEECQNSLKQVWEFSIDQFQSKIQELEYMLEEKADKLEQTMEKLSNLKQVYTERIEAISNEYEKMQEMYETQQLEMKQLTDKNSELNTHLSKQVEIKKKYTEEINRLKTENLELEKNIEAQNENYQTLVEKNNQLSKEIRSMKDSKPKVEPGIEIKELKTEQQRLTKALNDLQKQNKNQSEEINRMNALNQSLSSKLESTKNDCENLLKENNKLKGDNLEISEKVAKRRKDIESEDKDKICDIQTRLEEREDEITSLQSKLNDSSDQFQGLFEKYHKLALEYKSYHETAIMNQTQTQKKIEDLQIGLDNAIDSINLIVSQRENTKQFLTQVSEKLYLEKIENQRTQDRIFLLDRQLKEAKEMNKSFLRENDQQMEKINQDFIQKDEENYRLSNEIEELKQKLNEYSENEDNLDKKETQLKTTQIELVEAQKQLESTQTELVEAQKQWESTQTELVEAQKKLEKEKRINATIIAENNELKNSQANIETSDDEVKALHSQLVSSRTQNTKLKEIINASLPSMRDYLILQRRANDEIQQYVVEYERHLSSSLDSLTSQFNNVLQYIIELEEKSRSQNVNSEGPSNKDETIEALTTVILNLRNELGNIREEWGSLTDPIEEFKFDFNRKILDLRKCMSRLAKNSTKKNCVQEAPQLASVLEDMNDLDKKHTQISKSAVLLLHNMKYFLDNIKTDIMSYKMQFRTELQSQVKILQKRLSTRIVKETIVQSSPTVPNLDDIEHQLGVVDQKHILINRHATNFLHSIKNFINEIRDEFTNYQQTISYEIRNSSHSILSKISSYPPPSSGMGNEKMSVDVLREITKLEFIHHQIGKDAANSVLNLKSFVDEIKNSFSSYREDMSREIAQKSKLILSGISKIKPKGKPVDRSLLFHIKDTLQEIQIAHEEIKEVCGEYEPSSDAKKILDSIHNHADEHEKCKKECEEQTFERFALQSQIAMQSSITQDGLKVLKQDFSKMKSSVNECTGAIPNWIQAVQTLQESIAALSDELMEAQENNNTLQANFETEISQKDAEIESLNHKISELELHYATQDEVHVEHSRKKRDEVTTKQNTSKQAKLQIDSSREVLQDILYELGELKEEYSAQIDMVKTILMEKLNKKEAEMQIVQDNLESTTQNIAIVLLPCASMFKRLRVQLRDFQEAQENLKKEILSTHKEHIDKLQEKFIKQIDQLNKQKKETQSHICLIQDSQLEQEKKIKNLESDISTLKSNNAELQKENENLSSQLKEQSQFQTLISDRSDNLTKYKASVKAKLGTLLSHFKDIKKTNKFLKGSIEEYSYDVEFTRDQLIDIKEKLEISEREKIELKNSLSNLSQLQEEHQTANTIKLENLKEMSHNLLRQHQSLKLEYQELQKTFSSFTNFKIDILQSLEHAHELALSQQSKNTSQKNDILTLTKVSEENKAQAIECQKEIDSFLSSVRSSSQIAEEEIKSLELQCEELKDNNETLTLKCQNLTAENGNLKDKISELELEMKEYNRVHHTLLLDSAKITEDHKKLQGELEILQKSKNESVVEFAKVKQDMDSQIQRDSVLKQQEIDTLEENIKHKEEELAKNNETHLQEINQLQIDIAELKENLKQQNAKIEDLEKINLNYQEEISQLEKEKTEEEDKINLLHTESENYQNEINALKENQNQNVILISSLQEENAKCQEEVSRLTELQQEDNKKIESLKTENIQYLEEISRLQESQSENEKQIETLNSQNLKNQEKIALLEKSQSKEEEIQDLRNDNYRLNEEIQQIRQEKEEDRKKFLIK